MDNVIGKKSPIVQAPQAGERREREKIMLNINKHTSLFQSGIHYRCKKLHSTSPRQAKQGTYKDWRERRERERKRERGRERERE